MNNYNLINNKFYYKYINKKKILKKLKKYILLILNNKYKNKYNIDINFKKGKILFFKELLIINKKKLKNKKKTILYSNIKNKNKYKIGYILKKKIRLNNNILYLINKFIYKFIKKKFIKIKYKYFKKKIGYLIKLKIKNILNNLLILIDKYDNELYYKLYTDNNLFFKINKNYLFLVNNVIYNNKYNYIKVILSRDNNLFLKKLFKLEIPEIFKGIIKIKKIVRIPGPGGLSKVVVYSKNKNINIIGTCIGIKGLRIKNILKQLDNEKINIIEYSNNIYNYIKRIFYNIDIINITINNNIIYLLYNKKDISKLIGKCGYNIKLCKLLLDEYKLIIKCQ